MGEQRPSMAECLRHEWFSAKVCPKNNSAKADKKSKAKADSKKVVEGVALSALQSYWNETAVKRALLFELASLLPMDRADHMVEVFQSFDADNDSLIYEKDLRSAFERMGFKN